MAGLGDLYTLGLGATPEPERRGPLSLIELLANALPAPVPMPNALSPLERLGAALLERPVVRPGVVEFYGDDVRGHRWHLKGGNGEITAQGEGYTRRADAVRGVENIRDLLARATFVHK